jgi:energy-coupling factor transporter transmembrane protein EcfT
MIAAAKILTATTGIEQLISAFRRILRPLEHFGIPVADFFSMVGLTMKSLPRLKSHLVETYRLKVKEDNIQGFWNRTRIISMFLIPLIVQSLQFPEKYFKDDRKIEEKN